MNNNSHYIHDLYKFYTSTSNDNNVDIKLFRAITKDFGTLVSDKLLKRSQCLRMPHMMGDLIIVKSKITCFDTRFLQIDFKATKELGKTVYHLNEHSNGYKVSMRWFKNFKFTNYRDFAFVMTRANKRLLAQLFKNKITDYPEI